MSVSESLGRSVARGDLEAGHRLAPGDAQITGRLAESLLRQERGKSGNARATSLARAALEQDGTVVAAVATLGLNAAINGAQAQARHFFAYSERLSRRDLATQMWAIEDAVSRGNIGGALRHYDIALRTSPESADVLFPVLAAASANAQVRSQLVRLLAGAPPWAAPFVTYLVDNGKDPLVNMAVVRDASRAGFAVSPNARAAVVTALTRSGHTDEAWSFYTLGHGGLDRRRSRDPAFTGDIAAPTPLDWTPVESPGLNATIQRDDHGGLFEFSAPASVGGAVLQQLQLLPPGRYRLAGHGAGIDQPDGERPYWSITCHDGREFGRVEFPNFARSRDRFSGIVIIPAGCGIQMLQLVVRPVTAATGLSGQINRVQLEPVP